MSAAVLVDTDILIDAGRKLPEAVSFLEENEKDSPLTISAVTKTELMIGCRNKTELRAVEHFLERFNLIKLDEIVTDSAIDLLHRYRLSHGLLIPDALIAATALSLGASLVTKNQKDFRFIEDLNLLPYE